MTMFTDIKFLNLASTRLPKFARKKDFLWNFRCPICGDSQKNKNKCRGFVFQIKGELVYKCHNCQASMNLGKLIEFVDPILAKEYRLEKFQESGKSGVQRQRDVRNFKKVVANKTPVFKKNPLRDLTPLTELNNSHPAKEYILNRKLPLEALYFTEKFKEWTNSVKPNTFEDLRHEEPRIIIPFRDTNGDTFGYQGRSLDSDGLRYITVLLEERTKIFGLDTVDTSKTVYIVEGPLDSLLVENGVAMAGADVSTVPELKGADVVYVYDNEPRNKQITDRIQKHIKDGNAVVIWPSSIKEKDINDMVLAGHDVQSILQSNTYRGLKSTLKFNEWRK